MNTRLDQHEIVHGQVEDQSMVNLGEGVLMKEATVDFLNAVFDPFKATNAARVPDFQKQSSICMRDYMDNFVPSVVGDGTEQIQGVLFYWHYGFSSVTTSQFPNFGNTQEFYTLYWFEIPQDQVYNIDCSHTLAGVNNATIMPNNGSGKFPGAGGYAQAIRAFAGGLKVLPTIETITSSDTRAIRNIWGGFMTPADVTSWMAGNADLSDIVRMGRNVQEFANADGCTVRYDPFQYEEQLEMIPGNMLDFDESTTESRYSKANFDSVYMPFIYVMFNSTFDSATEEGTLYPVKLHASFWFEAVLKVPSPIFSMKSPVDINFPKVRALAGDTDVYNPVTKGHTFKNFLQVANTFVRDVVTLEKEMRPMTRVVVRGAKALNRGLRNKKKKKKKRKGVRRAKRGGGSRGMRLAGTTRDPRVNSAVPNL